jgi:hypothetical protein
VRGPVDQLVISRRFRASRLPRLDGVVERRDGAPGWQPDARGLDVDASRLEFRLRSFQAQQIDLVIDVSVP